MNIFEEEVWMQEQHFKKCQVAGVAVLMLAVLGGCSHYGKHDLSKTAKATIQGCTDPAITGTATLKEFDSPEGIKKGLCPDGGQGPKGRGARHPYS